MGRPGFQSLVDLGPIYLLACPTSLGGCKVIMSGRLHKYPAFLEEEQDKKSISLTSRPWTKGSSRAIQGLAPSAGHGMWNSITCSIQNINITHDSQSWMTEYQRQPTEWRRRSKFASRQLALKRPERLWPAEVTFVEEDFGLHYKRQAEPF